MMPDRLKISEGSGLAIQNLPLIPWVWREMYLYCKSAATEISFSSCYYPSSLCQAQTHTPFQAVWATSLF